jgi:ParB family chromosome partitioning protein
MNLPTSVQQKVASGVLSAGHARALLGLSDDAAIEKLAARIVSEGLSVRATEEIISSGAPKGQSAKKPKGAKSASPEIQGSAKKGTIVIEFAGAQDLQRITKAIEN